MTRLKQFAAVGSACELRSLELALDRLAACSGDVRATSWVMEDPTAITAQVLKFDVAVIFMSHWLNQPWPVDIRQHEDQIRDHIERVSLKVGTVCLATILRVPQPGNNHDRISRIRRLNLLAVRLSHRLGCTVIDLDRELAGAGAWQYRTDFTLGGPYGVEIAARHLAIALYDAGVITCARSGFMELIDRWQPPIAPDAAAQSPVPANHASGARNQMARLARQWSAGLITGQTILHLVYQALQRRRTS